MLTIEGYTIKLVNTMDGVLFFEVITPQNKTIKEIRYLKENKKGIYKTSIYGMKFKINVNNKSLILA